MNEKIKYIMSRKINLAAGTTAQFLGRTSDTPEVTFYVKTIDAISAPLEVNFYESPVVSADGTQELPVNVSRNINTPPQTLAFSSPTVTTKGDLLKTFPVLTDKHVGGHGEDGNGEFQLRKNTDYLYEITNVGTGASDVYINFVWVEVQ